MEGVILLPLNCHTLANKRLPMSIKQQLLMLGCCPGQQALQEICKYQSSTCLLLRPSLFARLVRELCLLFTLAVDYRWQSMALLALQEAAEAFMVRLLEDAYLCSLHAHQVTLIPQDLQLAQRLRGPKVGGI
ncbi:histone H3-like centromeric protein A [Ammospiza maritima maritima]